MTTYFNNSDDKRKFIVSRKWKLVFEGQLKKYNKIASSNSGVCSDKTTITILIENNIVKDIKHKSESCVITTSCTDILCEKIIGKKLNEAIYFMNNFKSFIKRENHNKELLEELIVFEDIVNKKTRDYCLELPANVILNALQD